MFMGFCFRHYMFVFWRKGREKGGKKRVLAVVLWCFSIWCWSSGCLGSRAGHHVWLRDARGCGNRAWSIQDLSWKNDGLQKNAGSGRGRRVASRPAHLFLPLHPRLEGSLLCLKQEKKKKKSVMSWILAETTSEAEKYERGEMMKRV